MAKCTSSVTTRHCNRHASEVDFAAIAVCAEVLLVLTAAQVVVAEIGVDMRRFPTAGHLSSWAGVCPGNHASAGKVTSGRTRHGDAWLKGVLCTLPRQLPA